MAKKSLILAFLIIFAVGFVFGYVWMAYDIHNGMYSIGQGKTFWQILSPI